MQPFSAELETRFLRYVQIDTQSEAANPEIPSTDKQYDLLNLLVDELNAIGASDVRLTDYATVLATIPATAKGATIGLLAHVDTAMDFSGTGVKPIIHRNYNGEPLVLPDDESQIIDPAAFPYLADKVGDDIITASGTTLLGADDKAGVAIIMVAANHLIQHPEIPHGEIRICFTPDEEIGRGVHKRLPQDLAVDFAYTFDGGLLGSVVFETFSADGATVNIKGVSIHPGSAYGQMVSAIQLAGKFIERLPQDRLTPATTRGKEGYIHPTKMFGNTAEMTIGLILRDFERDGLAEKGKFVQQLCDQLQAEEPRAKITCTIKKQYRNMRYWLEDNMAPVELAMQATRAIGVEPFSKPIRGGTDGSRLTEMGVATPNLFTGMQNGHGPLEWISLQDMVKSAEMCLELAKLTAIVS